MVANDLAGHAGRIADWLRHGGFGGAESGYIGHLDLQGLEGALPAEGRLPDRFRSAAVVGRQGQAEVFDRIWRGTDIGGHGMSLPFAAVLVPEQSSDAARRRAQRLGQGPQPIDCPRTTRLRRRLTRIPARRQPAWTTSLISRSSACAFAWAGFAGLYSSLRSLPVGVQLDLFARLYLPADLVGTPGQRAGCDTICLHRRCASAVHRESAIISVVPTVLSVPHGGTLRYTPRPHGPACTSAATASRGFDRVDH